MIRVSIIVVLFLVMMLFMHSCLTFRMSKKEIDEYFKSQNISGSQHQFQASKYNMHYVQAGDTTKPVVIFVHGSPGSLSAFIDFLGDTSLINHALVITTDRPGFGYSNFGIAEPSLQKQASSLKPILEKFNKNKRVILVGHSLGGPVIARMAMDYPEWVDGLIFVAASIDPALEPNELWFRAPLATPFLSWILPRSFRASNDEIYQLKPQLENMLPLWKKIHCPVIVLQGEKDTLVPAGNAEFAKKMLVNAPIETQMYPELNHFIPWNNPQIIKQAVLKLIQEQPASVTSK